MGLDGGKYIRVKYWYDQNVEVSPWGFSQPLQQDNQFPDRKIVLVGIVLYEKQSMEKDNVSIVK